MAPRLLIAPADPTVMQIIPGTALLADGGEEGQCGWLKDRFGLSWQVIPRDLMSYLEGEDTAGSERAMQEMLTQSKLDIEAIRRAYAGEA